MAKADVKDYILSVLEHLDCKGILALPTGNIHCQCPFHRPRRNVTAFGVSFVNEGRGYPYSCLSCGAKGNLAQLVSFGHKVSYGKALKMLNRNIVLTPITMGKLKDALMKLSEHSATAVASKHKVQLPPRSPNQSPMLKYMRKRRKQARDVMRVNHVIQRFGLYYCSTDRMAGRIIMPIHIGGGTVGMNDRSVDDSVRNKSLHIAGQNYNSLLYGLDEAAGKKVGVLVEGAFDLYQVHSAISRDKEHSHFGVVANMGTAWSDDKIALITDYFDELVIMFDNQKNDKGKNTGLVSAMKIQAMMQEMMPVRNVTLEYPEGKDPGICTKAEILTALYSTGYQYKSKLQQMISGSNIRI